MNDMRFALFCYCCPLIFDDEYLKHSKVFCPDVGSQVWRRGTERRLSLYFFNDHIHNLPFKIKYMKLQIGHRNESKSPRAQPRDLQVGSRNTKPKAQ